MKALSTAIVMTVVACVVLGTADVSAEQARKPPKPASIGPAQLPPVEKKASGSDGAPTGGAKAAPAQPAPKSAPAPSAARPAPAKPAGTKPGAEQAAPPPTAAAQIDVLQSTRLDGCLTAVDSGGWILTTLSDQRQIALVGDEDIPHHVGELVQVRGAFIGNTSIAQQKAPPPSKDTFDVDAIVVLAPSCQRAIK